MIRRSRGRPQSSDESDKELSESIPIIDVKIPKKRGRKPTEFKWTRVIRFKDMMDEDQPLYSIPRDLNHLREDDSDELEYQEDSDDKIINHDGLKKEQNKLKTKDYALTDSELRLYAEKLIIIRKSLL
jgi:hypothetical protein